MSSTQTVFGRLNRSLLTKHDRRTSVTVYESVALFCWLLDALGGTLNFKEQFVMFTSLLLPEWAAIAIKTLTSTIILNCLDLFASWFAFLGKTKKSCFGGAYFGAFQKCKEQKMQLRHLKDLLHGSILYQIFKCIF